MKRRNSLAFTLILLLVTSIAFAGCGSKDDEKQPQTTEDKQTEENAGSSNFNPEGLPIVNEPVTLRFVCAQHENHEPGFEGMTMHDRWERETNVKIKWDTVPWESWPEQKSLIVASGDLPDVFAGGGHLTDDEVMEWGAQGIIIPVKDLIGKHMPRLQQILEENPVYKPIITAPDGHIYAFPTVADIDFGSRGVLLYMSKKWLADTGRSYPVKQYQYVDMLEHSFTTDEFYEILSDFKKLHPDSIPFITPKTPDKGPYLFSMYGAFGLEDNVNHIIVKDGEVLFTADKPEWKEATKYFHKLYDEGLLDQEVFTHEYNVVLAKVQEKPQKVGSFTLWTSHQAFPDIHSEDYKDWLLTPPLIGPSGDQHWNKTAKYVTRGSFAITSACKHPEIAARFQDYLYDPDNSYQLSMGPYDRNLIKNADGTITMADQPADMEWKEWAGQNLNTMFITTPKMNEKVKWAEIVQMTIDVGGLYKQYQPAVDQYYPNILYNKDDSERLSVVRTDIQEYVSQMQAKWIVEGTIDKEWDGYLEQLKRIGLDEYLEIMQRNYERIAN